MGKRVMVVDDDPGIRDAIADILREEGYEVTCASDGAEALEALQHHAAPCLVLLDMMMPNMNGSELLYRLQHMHKLACIPVVVVSAHGGTSVPLGAQKIVRKPVSAEVLVSMVEQFCHHAKITDPDPGAVIVGGGVTGK